MSRGLGPQQQWLLQYLELEPDTDRGHLGPHWTTMHDALRDRYQGTWTRSEAESLRRAARTLHQRGFIELRASSHSAQDAWSRTQPWTPQTERPGSARQTNGPEVQMRRKVSTHESREHQQAREPGDSAFTELLEQGLPVSAWSRALDLPGHVLAAIARARRR